MARGLVDRITVATRAQGVLYDRTATADIGPIAAADARRAIEAGRSTSAMTSREGRAGVRELVVAAARVWPRPQVAEDLHETMRRLSAASSEIIRHTHEPALRAAARESVAAAEIPAASSGRSTSKDHARWWGVDVDHGPTRTRGEIAARSAKDTEATTTAHDAAKNRDRGRGLDR